jgi:stage IV sporulation protein B
VYECSIVGIHKGVRGKAGELRGMFLNDKHLGQAEKLCKCGIFGQISSDFVVDELMSAVASSCEAKPGKAYIYSTISGVEPKRYEIEIVKVDRGNKENKNYVLKITDEELIAETGGIVQGMSGSPILQGDRLIGAVTHVFLNDPTRGYGIDIDRMLEK